MTDTARIAAVQKVEFHEAEAARWRAWLVDYDSLVQQRPEPTVNAFASSLKQHLVRQARSRSGEMARTAGAVKRILEQNNRPLTTSQLLPVLEQMGISVGGQDPAATLSARLSRSPGLVHTRGVGWTVVPENNNATDPSSEGESVALSASTPAPAEAGSEVEHEKIG